MIIAVMIMMVIIGRFVDREKELRVLRESCGAIGLS